MILLRAAAALLLLIMIGVPNAAVAYKRVALVIGNGDYSKVPKLDNPKNDAAAMESMFKAAGFDTVVRANDLGVAAMRRALRDFSDTAHDADIAVVFYAGHGMEVGGINYLIPTDAVLERDIDVPDEAVSLDRVNLMLERVKHLRLVILDACRDNPFVRSIRRTITTRTVRSGYGEIDEKALPPNTLVAYAQRAGATAEDGAGANSPYTTALLKHLPTPGLDIELALRRVRDDVLKMTRSRQEPFKYGSLGGAELPLVSRVAALSPSPPSEVPVAGVGAPISLPTGWRKYSYPDDGFLVEFSGYVHTLKVLPKAKNIVRATTYQQVTGEHIYMVSVTLRESDFSRGLDAGAEASFAGFKCQSKTSDTELEFALGRARELSGLECMEGGQFRIKARYFVSKNFFYQVIAIFKSDEISAQHFLNSFGVIKR